MSQTLQEKNKALLLEGFDVLFNKRDLAGAKKYWSPNYIQHSSHIEPGRDGLFNLVETKAATILQFDSRACAAICWLPLKKEPGPPGCTTCSSLMLPRSRGVQSAEERFAEIWQ
jgi:hypothetical protein